MRSLTKQQLRHMQSLEPDRGARSGCNSTSSQEETHTTRLHATREADPHEPFAALDSVVEEARERHRGGHACQCFFWGRERGGMRSRQESWWRFCLHTLSLLRASIGRMAALSRAVSNRTEAPSVPNLPVRPTRCRWRMSETRPKSTPRESRSEQTSTRSAKARKRRTYVG
eukprot:5826760-Pleurochrysis_carterae.AAC.1